ncbi:hypothetical protein SPACI_005180 [Sporomusa acidovorans DSM 3132]|uniref:Amino acid permease YhdG n=1 Tax=Sporomusa acidovorans (strain ATCC 49682 / DSM 3132 / Mol) TaxID=1123286 RepID=A0ABZ3IWQ7_SPOA4|nr:putative amino acid permease YhdG [Sporomusa acidovorans DSM 3132]SDE44627.1 Amino acid permease [Sporomusa acidovorans]
MPIGIIGSLAICTVLYVLVAAVLTGVVPYDQLNNAEPVAYALRTLGYQFGSALVGTGAICGLSTVLLVMMYAQNRAFFAMSRDGLIPAAVCKIHPQYGTPHIITILVGMADLCFFCPIPMVDYSFNLIHVLQQEQAVFNVELFINSSGISERKISVNPNLAK